MYPNKVPWLLGSPCYNAFKFWNSPLVGCPTVFMYGAMYHSKIQDGCEMDLLSVFEDDHEEGIGKKKLLDACMVGMFLDQCKEEYLWNSPSRYWFP